LTPHAGEMARLLDRPVEDILKDHIQVATDAAARWKQIVVLKVGATVATDGEKAVIADDAPVSLATAGSGDVFSGFIAGLLAQGVAALDAAAIAMYAGSRAARDVEKRFGVRGIVAGDLPGAMAQAIAALDA
jgi:ADP-dependent NAD(P)H-hydrate dehydratase / NAD(P)H-hydrate epimerase